MNIRIVKSEIFKEVEKRSSIEGREVPERYDNVWADETMGEILDSYWKEGYTAAIQLLKRYISNDTIAYDVSVYDKDEVVSINADMPSRYNDLLDGNIETDIKMMIACNILHGWMEIVLPNAAMKYQEESEGYSEDLRVKILYRKSPESKISPSKTDSENLSIESKELSSPKADSVEICNHLEALKYPETYDVPLTQYRNNCFSCFGK